MNTDCYIQREQHTDQILSEESKLGSEKKISVRGWNLVKPKWEEEEEESSHSDCYAGLVNLVPIKRKSAKLASEFSEQT
jgi:hypothetical protein